MVKSKKLKITNFTVNNSFFFPIENFLNFINTNKNQNILKPNKNEINALDNIINNLSNNIKVKRPAINRTMKIIPKFFRALKSYQ